VNALRLAGVLGRSDGFGTGDSEYRAFITQTGFDFRTDLDRVAASFLGDESLYLANGRFDWKLLKGYATQAGGSCYDAYCSMPASKPGFFISLIPLRPDLMAIGVGRYRDTVKRMLALPKRSTAEGFPDQPIWLSLNPSAFKSVDSLPAIAQLFAQSVRQTERVTFAVASQGERFEAALDVNCRNSQDAIQLMAQFETITETLRKAAAEKGTGPAELASVLAGGHFQREDRTIAGRWPIPRAFLESLSGGTL
jgi:hypothetical protein